MDFKILLKHHRERKQLTKTSLAKELSVSLTVIADYEKGKISPTLDKGMQLAKLFKLTHSETAKFLDCLLDQRLSSKDRPYIQLIESSASSTLAQHLPVIDTPLEKGASRNSELSIQSPFPLKPGDDVYAIRCNNEHPMTEYGIHNGDYLICNESIKINAHDLVLVVLNNSPTIRKVDFLNQGSILFQACNSIEQSVVYHSINDADQFKLIAKVITGVKSFDSIKY